MSPRRPPPLPPGEDLLPPEGTEPPPAEDEVVELPIDGNLDLHFFHPREVKPLVIEYLWACRQKGLLDVRIIHGKGMGALRRTVQSLLPKLEEVESFRSASESDGGWGATWVRLKPLEAQDSQK
ncbi:Smr/MutS family protein [Myxococcus landrumensis]|uniref:Smr/MutS family protein n=1 Tax=Myxococcus landrumensis TaxID=2813577 RepID=A0ABX7N7F7_9BACT|nr:Smr/MutS family protein [Myxococcus landrumus]QSQ14696.1 Smr/MutS family protein [Myxococcus landrumus]